MCYLVFCLKGNRVLVSSSIFDCDVWIWYQPVFKNIVGHGMFAYVHVFLYYLRTYLLLFIYLGWDHYSPGGWGNSEHVGSFRPWRKGHWRCIWQSINGSQVHCYEVCSKLLIGRSVQPTYPFLKGPFRTPRSVVFTLLHLPIEDELNKKWNSDRTKKVLRHKSVWLKISVRPW